ncbi:unnamed protein product [Enterobius vermicularis]|uniref:RAB8A, member RAS oncogene family n=1 Tax=Enterobius vermicularis TaxID=51028 RepID=A0A0N4V7D0_ENTVE|nr:unnamed protein product [Enterobius vermicularis]
MLIGCKSDLKRLRSVTYEEAENFSLKYGLSLFETSFSAKTNLNCMAALNEMVNKVQEKREEVEAFLYDSSDENEEQNLGVSRILCNLWSCA